MGSGYTVEVIASTDPATDAVLSMWTVYQRPRDFPKVEYLARRWEVVDGVAHGVPTRDVRTARTLEGIRESLPPGLCRIERGASDDLAIVEVWL